MVDAETIWTEAKSLGVNKWIAGKQEHGGDLLRKPVLGEAVDEAIDLVSYLLVLKGQVEEAKREMLNTFDVLLHFTQDQREALGGFYRAFRILHYGNPEGEE